MPSFQSPLPKSGRPCAPAVRPLSIARTQCSNSVPSSRRDARLAVRLVLVRRRAAARRGTARARRARRCRRSSRTYSATTKGSQSRSSEQRDAQAAAARLVPPVLHVAFDELPAGGAQQVRARQVGPREQQRHHVLQLIAEAERAARLVVAGARPQPAAHVLVEQPAVHQHVERVVRRAAPGSCRASRPTTPARVAARPSAASDRARGARSAARRASASVPWPSRNTICARLAGRERDLRPAAPRTDRARRRSAGRASRRAAPPGGASEPLRPMNDAAIAGRRRGGSLACANATRAANSSL